MTRRRPNEMPCLTYRCDVSTPHPRRFDPPSRPARINRSAPLRSHPLPLAPASLRPVWTLVVVVLVAATLAGCSSSREAAPTALPEAFPNHSLSEIQSHLLASHADTLHSFSADARVTVRSPQRNGTFNATVRQKRDDSLLMTLSLFGIEGARVLVTPDSFFVYDRRNGQLMLGRLDDAGAYLPAPIASEQVFENMLGLVRPESSIDWSVSADSARYYLTSPSERRTVVVDPAQWRVIRYAEYSSSGDLVQERLFDDFQMVNGVRVPKRVVFRRPPDKTMALLDYKDLSLNPSGLTFDLGAPDDVRRVPVP